MQAWRRHVANPSNRNCSFLAMHTVLASMNGEQVSVKDPEAKQARDLDMDYMHDKTIDLTASSAPVVASK